MNVKSRIAFIDGLRAIAVLSVVAYHTALNASAHHSADRLGILAQGQHGVDLFFVLSGFCLAYPTLARIQREGGATFDVVGYAAHRLVRIVPPYWAAIALFTALALWLQTSLPRSMPQHGFTALDVMRQAFFFGDAPHYLNGDFWTLALEFRWYFVFPVLLFVWTRSPRAFALIGAVCPLLLLTGTATYLDLFVLPAFMLGIVAAHAYVFEHPLARFALPAFVLIFAVALLTGNPVAGVAPSWQFAAFLFVVAAGANHHLSRLLSVKWLAAIGTASYSIYLIHDPFLALLQSHGAAIPIAVLGTLAIGFAFWWVVERPFLSGAARDRCVGALQQCFRAMRLAKRMQLHARPPQSTALSRT